MCEFRIGQKVVCVDAEPMPGRSWWPNDDAPIVGHVYTIAGIVKSNSPKITAFELLFAEIKRASGLIVNGKPAFGYGAWRFRPLVTDDSKYDISVFRQMCADATKRVSAE